MKEKHEEKIIIIVLVIGLIIFKICNINYYNPRYTGQAEDRVHNEKILKDIISYLDNKNTDKLKALFSQSVSSRYNLDSQIKTVLKIYGGTSSSYTDFFDWGYTSKKTSNGRCVEKSVGAQMENIKTKDNDIFIIGFGKCVVNDAEPDDIGIVRITLCDEKGKKLAPIGSVYDGEIINGKMYKSN